MTCRGVGEYSGREAGGRARARAARRRWGSDGVFLTGATGFVGMELLAPLSGAHRPSRVCARARGRTIARRRRGCERTLLGLFGPDHPYSERVVAVPGDITRPGLGLRAATRRGSPSASARSCTAPRRCRLSRGSRMRSRSTWSGTLRMLEFAERCQARGGLRRFSYISTAYVAGEHAGCFSEDDLDVGQRFRNAYEQSKFEAECLLADMVASGCRSRSCARASSSASATTAGRRRSTCCTGRCARSRAAPMRRCRRAATRRSTSCPVDYVADAIFALSQAAEAEGATFHLTAGAQASSVGELVELASAFFGRPPPRLVDPVAVSAGGAPAARSSHAR